MTIISEIERIKNNINNAYDVCESKGSVITVEKNSDNLATAINGIPSKKLGISLDDLFGTIDSNKVLQAPPMENLTVDLTGIKDIGDSALEERFIYNDLVYKVIAPDLERVSGNSALAFMCTDGGQYIEEVSCPKLSVVSGANAFTAAFRGCLVLNVDFGNLREVSGSNAFSYAFEDNNELYECNIFDNIETISGNYAFKNCFKNVNGLWESTGELNINATSITGSDALYDAFRGIENVYVVNFPNLTTVTTKALRNACAMHPDEIHFRADMQPIISTLTGYAEKFGAGDDATIYFDL